MISILIPSFNHLESTIPLLKKLAILVNDLDYEIIVDFDDSPDGTTNKLNIYMKFNIGITTAFYKYIYADTFITQIVGIGNVYACNYLASSSSLWKK